MVFANGDLQAQVLSEPEALARNTDAWFDLLARSDADDVTLSPTWLLPWWRIFGGGLTGRRLCTCLFWQGRTLVGLAPLLRRWRIATPGLPFARVELMGTGEPEEDEIASDYLGIITARGHEAAVAEALASLLVADGAATGRTASIGRWDELVLTALDGELPLPTHLGAALARRGLGVRLIDDGASLHVPLPRTFDAYLAALPPESRYFARRSLREFEAFAQGRARFHRAESAADLAGATRVLMALHEQRWRAAGHGGVFASPRFEAFHRAVMPALLARGALDLRWLTVADRPVAAAYNLVSRGRVQFYQGGRAVDVPARARVGIALHLHAIRAAIDDGRVEYDFLAGHSQYKRQLSLAARPIMRLVVERPSTRRLALRWAARGADWLRGQRHRLPLAAAPGPGPATGPPP